MFIIIKLVFLSIYEKKPVDHTALRNYAISIQALLLTRYKYEDMKTTV